VKLARVMLIVFCIALAFAAGWLSGMTRMGAAIDPVNLPEVERQFIEKMNGAALVGHFTLRGRDLREGPPDRYDIYSVEKVGEDLWRFNSKIGEVGVTVPVVVRMRFVDDTPLIVMTDAGIPGMGEGFSARVVFHEDQYAGTWGHGPRGGLMFGRIERGGAQR
jgi:hypothetical protein